MVVFGVDPHKHSHTVVAVDHSGRQLGQLTVSASGRAEDSPTSKLPSWLRLA
jgi:transposase